MYPVMNSMGRLVLDLYQEELYSSRMSKREVIEKLIRCSLTTTNTLDFAKLEHILILIQNVEPLEEQRTLSKKSLIILLVENAIRCNEMEWKTLDDAVPETERPRDPLVIQVLSRTAVHDITKYLWHRKQRSSFWEKTEKRQREHEKPEMNWSGLLRDVDEDGDEKDNNGDGDDRDGLWRLWKSGMNYFVSDQQSDSRHCYAVRAFLHAQST